MLKLFNDLKPFFEDCYNRIHVRGYAKLIKISPPTASSLLSKYEKETLLIREIDRNNILFYANRENDTFIQLSRIYWSYTLEEIIRYLESNLTINAIILFGSLSKGETTRNSDIDLAIFSDRKLLNLSKFEEKLGRKIQLFFYESLKDIDSKELRNNILNGYILSGRLKL